MTAEEIIGIIEEHLAQAEYDLSNCGRGSNHGRVNELHNLLLHIKSAMPTKD